MKSKINIKCVIKMSWRKLGEEMVLWDGSAFLVDF